jgi:hypothetical protein
MVLVDNSSLTVRERPSKGRHRPAHTNAGKFMFVQADYRAGRLSAEGEEVFERVCLNLHRLWKDATS